MSVIIQELTQFFFLYKDIISNHIHFHKKFVNKIFFSDSLGTQYMVNVLFSRARGPVQTYGKIQLMLVDALGINETFTLTQ